MTNKALSITSEMFQFLAPVLYITRIFGLTPLKWKKVDNYYVIYKSSSYITYSFIIGFFFIISAIFGLNELYKLEVVYLVRWADSTERYVTMCDVGVVLIPSFVAILTAAANIDKYIEYLKCLKKVDTFLGRTPIKSLKYMSVPISTMLFTGTILTLDLVLWVLLSTKDKNILLLLVYYLPYYACYNFTVQIELVYWQLIHTIRVRIISLNDKLIKFGQHENSFQTLFDKIIDNKSISNAVDTFAVSNIKLQQNVKKSSLNQVRDLINAYEKLTEATNIVNECYGFMILIVILGCLIHLLVTPYALYVIVLNTGNSMFILSQSMWMVGHVLRLLLIVEPCHGCLLQTNLTSQIVCQIMNSDLNFETKKLFEFFLIYLKQCKIEFTAFGLTKIHRGLLTTIAGAVTTYLVILFQFNKHD